MLATTTFITVYLPSTIDSNAVQAKKQRVNLPETAGSRGSMWSNIAKERKEKDES